MTTRTPEWRVGPVRLDVDGSEVLAQYDWFDRWNGWLCPAMDARSVVQVLNLFGDDPEYGITYDFEGDVLVLTEHQWRREAERAGKTYEPERVSPDADGLYSLGAYGWCWWTEEMYAR